MRTVLLFPTLSLCLFSVGQVQRQELPGRYVMPGMLLQQMANADTEKLALSYLEGVYDLTQDSGQSCAALGTTTPLLLEKIYSDYLQAHPDLMQGERTAAGVAAKAFAQYWPCHK